jgi:Type II secretion system (T2SS), protein E, N-terminal domain
MMRALNRRLLSWTAAWRNHCAGLAPRCGCLECIHAGSLWHRMRRRSRGVRLQGARYCGTECLEWALAEVFAQTQPAPRHGVGGAAHRIPLGLHLLSRHQLTAAQLRVALEAQRVGESEDEGEAKNKSKNNNKKKIGAWLQELGFASEHQITAALARQWSCPVLRTGLEQLGTGRAPAIPVLLLESFQMIPVELAESTGTLLMAFSEGIDYTVLYSIERMLGCRTEACLVCPSTLQKSLQELARRGGSDDIVFDRAQNAAECIRIIGNYSANVRAQEIRLARCGEHFWVRLERLRQKTLNLVLRVPANFNSRSSVLSSR